jgi:hypothetical protein
MKTRTLASAGALAAAALLLTACGSDGGDKSSDKIEGAGQKQSASPSASAPADAFDFPDDLHVVVDENATGDKAKDEILRDHANGLRAMRLGYAKVSGDLPVMKKYLTGFAGSGWAQDIAKFKKNGTTIAGNDHFYQRKVASASKTKAVVTFCEDQRKAYPKNLKTGKITKGTPSTKDFRFYRTTMSKSGSVWQISGYQAVQGDKQCIVS